MLHNVSTDFATFRQTGHKRVWTDVSGMRLIIVRKDMLGRRDLDENCGIFAFNISRATTLISISQMGQSRTLGWLVQHQQWAVQSENIEVRQKNLSFATNKGQRRNAL